MQKFVANILAFRHPSRMIFGYARVSTDGQSIDAQVKTLRAAGAEEIFRETASGAKTDRTQLRRALDALGEGETLLPRPSCALDAIGKAGARFRSLGDAWADTTTAHGRLMLTVLGGLFEFERELIRARTSDGRGRAKARSVHMGRPAALTRHQREKALAALAESSATQADLARRFNVSRSTISRLV